MKLIRFTCESCAGSCRYSIERMRMHECWGNYPGPHHHGVPLDDVIDIDFDASLGTCAWQSAIVGSYRCFAQWRPPLCAMAPPLNQGGSGALGLRTRYHPRPQHRH